MTRALLLKLAAGLGAVALVATGVVVVGWHGGGSGRRLVAGAAQAWVDGPLDGASVALGPLDVLAHAADPAGVALVALDADGRSVATEAPTGSTDGGRLALARFRWTPSTGGVHHLEVRGQNRRGRWGMPGAVTVVVNAPAGAGPGGVGSTATTSTTLPGPGAATSAPLATAGTTTSTAHAATTITTATTRPGATTTTPPSGTTTTTAPATTTSTTRPAATTTTTAPPATTTTTVCALGTVRATQPADGATVTATTPVLGWVYSQPCDPSGFSVELTRDNTFTRIEQSASVAGSARSWTVGTALPADCTVWYWRVRALQGRTFGAWSVVSSFRVGGRAGCP